MGTVFQGDVQTDPGPGHRATRHCGRGSLARCRMIWTSLCSSKRLAPIKSRHAQVAATQCGLPERDHQTANCQPCRHSNAGHAAFRFQPKLSSKSAENGAPHASSGTSAGHPKRWRAPPSFGGMAAEIVERVVSLRTLPTWGQQYSSAWPRHLPRRGFFLAAVRQSLCSAPCSLRDIYPPQLEQHRDALGDRP